MVTVGGFRKPQVVPLSRGPYISTLVCVICSAGDKSVTFVAQPTMFDCPASTITGSKPDVARLTVGVNPAWIGLAGQPKSNRPIATNCVKSDRSVGNCRCIPLGCYPG